MRRRGPSCPRRASPRRGWRLPAAAEFDGREESSGRIRGHDRGGRKTLRSPPCQPAEPLEPECCAPWTGPAPGWTAPSSEFLDSGAGILRRARGRFYRRISRREPRPVLEKPWRGPVNRLLLCPYFPVLVPARHGCGGVAPPHQVPEADKRERSDRLRAVIAKSGRRYIAGQIGAAGGSSSKGMRYGDHRKLSANYLQRHFGSSQFVA